MARTARKGLKLIGVFLFLIYLAGLVYFLFFSEGFGRGAEGAVYDCNFVPFREIRRYLIYWRELGIRSVVLNLAGNVAGFLPFGALLPFLVHEARSAWKTGLLSFEVSALIEVSQLLFQVGCFDVDDMILNTLGGLLGYGVFWISGRWARGRMGKTWQNGRATPLKNESIPQTASRRR